MKIAAMFIAMVASCALSSTATAQSAATAPVTSPVADNAQIAATVDGINRFSLDLYQKSIAPERNLFLSPASVSTAIGLAYRGAIGRTANEIRTALRFPAEPRTYGKANAALLRRLPLAAEGRELRIANALWLQEGMPLNPDYLADVTTDYAAGLHRVDYRKDSDAARLTINEWVDDATKAKIKDLLEKEDVTDLTRAVLVNAVYWKGGWASRFSSGSSRSEAFTRLDGRKVQTMLMNQRAQFRVLERGGVDLIALPYAGHEISMIVVMPDKPTALPALESRLTAEELSRWLGDLRTTDFRDTILTLPRMHLEWRGDLVPTLSSLGMKLAFSDRADFSGMVTFPYPGEVPEAEGLKIKHVIHKTFLDVDETGSEAAAATAVIMDIIVSSRRAGPPPPPPFVFRADKPFLFLLRDNRTGVILFIGRYVAPPEA